MKVHDLQLKLYIGYVALNYKLLELLVSPWNGPLDYYLRKKHALLSSSKYK